MPPIPLTTLSATPSPSPISPPSTSPSNPQLATHLIILLTILSTLVTLAILLTLYNLYQRHIYRALARYWIWKTDPTEAQRGRDLEPRIRASNARFYGPGIDRGEDMEMGDVSWKEVEVEMKTLRSEEGKFRCVDVKRPGRSYRGWREGRGRGRGMG